MGYVAGYVLGLVLVALVAGLVLFGGASRARALDLDLAVKARPLVPRAASEATTPERGWLLDPAGASMPTTGTAAAGSVSRAELVRRLKDLAQSAPPDPATLRMGAMCYEMSAPSGTYDFVCGTCGAKTVLPAGDGPDGIEDCRRLVQALRQAKHKLDATLDDRAFCEKCRPPLAGGGLALVVRYPDVKEPRRVPIDASGLQALVAFLNEKPVAEYERGEQRPLKERLADLQQLLGAAPEADARK